MMASKQTVTVNVIADTKRFSSAMQGAGGQTNAFSGILKNFGIAAGVAFAAATAATVAYGIKAVSSASDLEQSIGGVQAVFKEYAGTVEESSKKAAGALGLSRDAYNKVATIIGTQLKASGTTLDELAGKTDNLLGISSDLSATFGGDVVDAANAVSSALRGEFLPLRQYGISLTAAQIEAEALSMTHKTLKTDLTAAEKAAATQSLIFQGSADASGQFAREADTLAGKQQRLNAQLDNVQATIGEVLLPIVSDATEQFGLFIGELVEKPEFKTFLDQVAGALGDVMKNLPSVLENMMSFGRDALPVVQSLLPFVNSALELLVNLFEQVESTDPSSTVNDFAGSMRDVADGINSVTNAFKFLDDAWNKIPLPVRQFLANADAGLNPFARGIKALGDVLAYIPNMTPAAAPPRSRIKLAEGGIVMPRPGGVQATIAEAGQAEAVIPLDKMGSMGTTVVINGNVGYSAVELAREISRRQAQVFALNGVNRLMGVS